MGSKAGIVAVTPLAAEFLYKVIIAKNPAYKEDTIRRMISLTPELREGRLEQKR